MIETLLKVKPPKPCPPNNPNCHMIPAELSIDGWIGIMIIVAIIYGYLIIKKHNKYGNNLYIRKDA